MSDKKPFWQSKTLWSLSLLVVSVTAMPIAEMIEKREAKPTDIAKILVAYALAAPVAYYRSKATQPLGLAKPVSEPAPESVSVIESASAPGDDNHG
jgi:hypothetical protein